ncbi:LAME_0D00694g1_1 [Lachancea meyersii CBS 8951]|uniref:LAME_0D00694g1_1 n=1 Tax=Lachancea meyersii CBS 8951 TaxID=1266667 RepID=A0A1G4J5Y6_9SACH|nr:LAME_0D00694g1_1 [Lachancea meyersii CBS 8951]
MTGTFDLEHLIPVLPIPDLDSTFEQLEACMKPLNVADGYYKHFLQAGNYYQLYRAVSRFLKSKVAQKLQSKVRELNELSSHVLDSLQLDTFSHALTAEIEGDVLPRNPFLVLSPDALEGISQQNRAGVLCYSALKFISALRHGILPPDKDSSGKPLSMLPYVTLFGTTRSPFLESDEIPSFGEAPSNGHSATDLCARHAISKETHLASKHIVIISRGQYYSLDVLDSDNRPLYDDDSLSQVMHSVLQDSFEPKNLANSTSLGSFTAYSLKRWKHARNLLREKCATQLAIIDSALFVLILDESSSTSDISRECKRLFYGSSLIGEDANQQGSCCSRWYDKLQLVVTKDAKASVIWDSLTCDGSAVMRFASDMFVESVLRLAREIDDSTVFSLWPITSKIDTSNIKGFHKINWEFCEALKESISISESNLTDLICRHDIVQKEIPYGRNVARRLGVNADAMIQVAIQIAHYALYGKMASTFEPVSTRTFRNSRSAFVPVQNQQMFELCQIYNSNALGRRSKLEKFTEACERHLQSVQLSKRGQGFEKHYNILRYLFQNHEEYQIELDALDLEIASDVFENASLDHLSSPEIIAAHCGNSAIREFGINPAVPQGFGIGYSLEPDRCDLTITSQFRQGNRFLTTLKYILDEIVSCKVQFEKTPASTALESDKIGSTCLLDIYRQADLGQEICSIKNLIPEADNVAEAWDFRELNGSASSKRSTQPASADFSSCKASSRSRRSSSITMDYAPAFFTDIERNSVGREIPLADLAPAW